METDTADTASPSIVSASEAQSFSVENSTPISDSPISSYNPSEFTDLIVENGVSQDTYSPNIQDTVAIWQGVKDAPLLTQQTKDRPEEDEEDSYIPVTTQVEFSEVHENISKTESRQHHPATEIELTENVAVKILQNERVATQTPTTVNTEHKNTNQAKENMHAPNDTIEVSPHAPLEPIEEYFQLLELEVKKDTKKQLEEVRTKLNAMDDIQSNLEEPTVVEATNMEQMAETDIDGSTENTSTIRSTEEERKMQLSNTTENEAKTEDMKKTPQIEEYEKDTVTDDQRIFEAEIIAQQHIAENGSVSGWQIQENFPMNNQPNELKSEIAITEGISDGSLKAVARAIRNIERTRIIQKIAQAVEKFTQIYPAVAYPKEPPQDTVSNEDVHRVRWGH